MAKDRSIGGPGPHEPGRRMVAAPADGGGAQGGGGGTGGTGGTPPAGGGGPPTKGPTGPTAGGVSPTGSTGGGGGVWLLHDKKPLSPLIDVNIPSQVYDQVYALRNTMAVPADATASDAKAANAIYLRVNDKRFDATAQAMVIYADLLPKTLARMQEAEFEARRKIADGNFTVANGMGVVQGAIRLNGVLRTDELCDVADMALQEARELAAGPDGANNARAQALLQLLSVPAQALIDRQQQGKDDSAKQDALLAEETGKTQAQLAAALAEVARLTEANALLQQEKTLNSTGAPAVTPPATKGTKHTPATPPSVTPPATTPAAPTSRKLPRK